MAYIYIKGRSEPLEVKCEVAKQIKKRWFEKMDTGRQNDLLEIGEWAGEYSQIKCVETTPDRFASSRVDVMTQAQQEREHFRQQPPEKKAECLGYFKMIWWQATQSWGEEPPADILEKAKEILIKYYRKNPNAEHAGREVFKSLIGSKETLADKMTM